MADLGGRHYRTMTKNLTGLYNHEDERSSCGVGFLTRKDSKQTHDLLVKGHQALCAVPHRGGMSSEGIGDGAGISVDLSVKFFRKVSGVELEAGAFGVGNFFLPADEAHRDRAQQIVEEKIEAGGFTIVKKRKVEVNNSAIGERSVKGQLPIIQWIFTAPDGLRGAELDSKTHEVLLDIESVAYTDEDLAGLYPLSLSARLQVLKGRLNSWEIIPYYQDLSDEDHEVHTMYFHTRFSTNTDPHPSMAQPFRLMAHNGELNTDKKNRLSEAAVALARNKNIIRPKGQSDSCRLDQTLNSRVFEDSVDLVTAVVAMMPPAWENDPRVTPEVRAMLEYFSLFEEKNDGPAALIFGNGTVVGARLDRLGLRPLRSVETEEYVAVMSEQGQISFPPETVIRRGRVEAGGMIYYDHAEQKLYDTDEALTKLAGEDDYAALVAANQVVIDDLPEPEESPKDFGGRYKGDLGTSARYVAYTHNQESFKFLMDPMLQNGIEKVSAMGYGNAINSLSDHEGGVAKYFSQRFAQVTNPPLDSIREADGMTLRVALGEKPHFGKSRAKQIIVHSPILRMADMLKIRAQEETPWQSFPLFYKPEFGDKGAEANEKAIVEAIDKVANEVVDFARDRGGIAILSDRHVSTEDAALPATIAVSAINQRLIEEGLRFKVSLVLESGQIASSHHIACALGFGAAAVYPLAVRLRAEELFGDDAYAAFGKFKKAAEKAIMKTMGKVGLCTVESYSGGEFFEPNFLDTNDPVIARYLPNMKCPVGGVQFDSIARSVADWHERALTVKGDKDVPILGLFKERSEGAGHSYGTTAVRGFVDMTEEEIAFEGADRDDPALGDLTLRQLNDAFGLNEDGYVNTSYDMISPDRIDSFSITKGYRAFIKMMSAERDQRPAALRDVLGFPADVADAKKSEDFDAVISRFDKFGNNNFLIRGLECESKGDGQYELKLVGSKDAARLKALGQSLESAFGKDLSSQSVAKGVLKVTVTGDSDADRYLARVETAPAAIDLKEVQPAHEITPTLASGAMSHGALVATAHEAVAHGTNMVGAMSNSGEGGEHSSRYGTIRASRIKQFASGRFGVWAGYLADPNLEEIEIKIAQGAKPGEGGQLPGFKVPVEIAAARGGTPGVELISPPPHHDTYSIEDLGQLIHDAKAARVRVIVKLVSSEGIGTIAVGVAKAGADLINVAGSSGGTGAAAVTSLKYTGRAAEIGISEVHQALCANGIRQKVLLRCSGAMQTGSDVVKAALLGADSFEFGTTALMMLKCVMAKNCNVKCPAGLTTNAETFEGDPRALAQYLLNLAHEVREILAELGFKSLKDIRGRTDLLHLIDHEKAVGQMDLRAMLTFVPEIKVDDPIYLEKDFRIDNNLLKEVEPWLRKGGSETLELQASDVLNNRNKSVGGQLSIDIERLLNHQIEDLPKAAMIRDDGRRILKPRTVKISTEGSAGQSYGAFNNEGMVMHHTGTCNDGVGKGACGGEIIVKSPAGGCSKSGQNVLIGNFALFGATGGRLFVDGQAGDRFAVRNSGASAVVEGVGDFCCEYMTNGSVLNLGGFSKGLGNGMSGGFAYQYDPAGQLSDLISHDSVFFGSFADGSEQAEIHEPCIKKLLTWHIAATGSVRASVLLDEWEKTRSDMYWIMPKALLVYQDADAILAERSRKDLMEELANALCQSQIKALKEAWRDGKEIMDGYSPAYGEMDTDDMFRLLNSYTVLEMAQSMAAKRAADSDAAGREKMAKNLILTQDFFLMSNLAKHAKEAIADYDDDQLAALVANKRINDFKTTLAMRVSSRMDKLGTYAWIDYQTNKIEGILGEVPSFDELFAKSAIPAVLERSSK